MSINLTGPTLPARTLRVDALRRHRPLRVALAGFVAATGLTLGAAWPASAHDTTLPDVQYYRSTVTSISPAIAGLKIRLTAGGESVTLTNDTGKTVDVLGYNGEDYLRFTPAGVDENTNSLSAFLNGSLVVSGLPQQLGDTTGKPPAWHHVADTVSYSWHDHRIHWMVQQRPPVVAADPSHPHHVLDWSMRFKVDGQPVTVQGSLDWVGAPESNGLRVALLVLVAVLSALLLAILLLRLHLGRKADGANAAGPPSSEHDSSQHEELLSAEAVPGTIRATDVSGPQA